MPPVILDKIAYQKLGGIKHESFHAGCQLVRPVG
jgi:hypothetical protein